jgi:solute carrier family 25 (mitochondrial 2-oxodicarboxylate transporter), member 21
MVGYVCWYNRTYPALVKTAREEGFAALYKGFTPKVGNQRLEAGWLSTSHSRTDTNYPLHFFLFFFKNQVLRLAPGGGVLLLVVEALSSVFRKSLGPPYI